MAIQSHPARASGDEASENCSLTVKEQMRLGTIAARDVLGQDVPGLTDRAIQEALWHYYYDVEKSVGYLLQSKMPKQETNKNKKAKGGSLSLSSSSADAFEGTWRTGVEAGLGDTEILGGASPRLIFCERHRSIAADTSC